MGAMLSRIVSVGGLLQVSARFPDRDDVETEFPARKLESNLDIFERTMGIPPEGRTDPAVRDKVVEVMTEAVASAPEGREHNDDFWLSYSVGALWIYLNDPERAEDHGVCVLDELVSEGVARLVVRNMDDEVTFGVVTNAQSIPEGLRYLN